jgi:predicted DNA-binding transcriptional regulator YafY
MRHEKAALLLELAWRLAASAEGLTLDEMAAAVGVGRRTVERMREMAKH